MIAMFKLFYNTIAACQRPVGPLLLNKCMYVCMYISETTQYTYATVCFGEINLSLVQTTSRKWPIELCRR